MLYYSLFMFSEKTKSIIIILRITLGWLFFYAGLIQVLDKGWSAHDLLLQARHFPEFFAWFAQADIIHWVNIANSWGILLIGASLIIGLYVRLTSVLGMILMALYYLLLLKFPHTNDGGYLVDKHVIYFICLALLFITRAGDYWGIDARVILRIKD